MVGYRKLIALALGVLGNVAVSYSGVDAATVDQLSNIITALVGAFIAGNLVETKMNQPKAPVEVKQ